METAFSFSTKLVVSSTNVVKFFIPRVLYDPRVFIVNSAKIVRYFIPTRIANLGEKCAKYIGILSSVTCLLNLLEQFQELEETITMLRESVLLNTEKYSKAQMDNDRLSQQISCLEQQIKDMELRNEERSKEQERLRGLIKTLKEEMESVSECASQKIILCEADNAKLKEELDIYRTIMSRIEADRERLLKQVEVLNEEINVVRKDASTNKEQGKSVNEEDTTKNKMIDELLLEVKRLKEEIKRLLSRSDLEDSTKCRELYKELCALKQKNFLLEEANDDLKSSLLLAGLEQGQLMVMHKKRFNTDVENMNRDEIHKALKEEQDCNSLLKSYIDGILTKIMENHPQLLEIQQMRK